MPNVLDFVEPGPLLSDEVVKPPIVSKATVQRCISKLSPHWTDEAGLDAAFGAANAKLAASLTKRQQQMQQQQ